MKPDVQATKRSASRLRTGFQFHCDSMIRAGSDIFGRVRRACVA